MKNSINAPDEFYEEDKEGEDEEEESVKSFINLVWINSLRIINLKYSINYFILKMIVNQSPY